MNRASRNSEIHFRLTHKYCVILINTLYVLQRHSAHWGINPLKNTLLFLANRPPLNRQTVKAPPPFLGNLPLYIGFSLPPVKVGSFSEPPKY